VSKTAVTRKTNRSKEGQQALLMMRLEGAIQREFDADLLVKFCRVLPGHQELIDIGQDEPIRGRG